MGHRGAMGHAPENSLAAFRLGHALGADLLECDVHLASDSVAVVIHDETVDRTSNGRGRVRDQPSTVLGALEPPVMSLRTLLHWLRAENLRTGRSVPLVIELKTSRGLDGKLADAVVADLAATGMSEQALVISFDHPVIARVRALAPGLPVGALYLGRVMDPVALAITCGASWLLPSVGDLDAALVACAHAAGLRVLAWTANTADEMAWVLQCGADGAGTNFPDRLLALRDRGPLVHFDPQLSSERP